MNNQLAMVRKTSILKIVALSAGLALTGAAHALHFEPSEGTTIDVDTTLAYGAMWRLQSPQNLKPVVPMNLDAASDNRFSSSSDGFSDLVLQWNSDDGDRNFKKGAMVSDRYAAVTDYDFRHGKFGLFLRTQIFYDAVYFGKTDWTPEGWNNFSSLFAPQCGSSGGGEDVHQCPPPVGDSPANVDTWNAYNGFGTYVGPESINNAYASGDITDPSHFSDKVKAQNGYRARFLDSYVYGSFDVGGHTLDLRLGRQAISWGESLLLQGGIGFAQNRIDATAATSPGVELKEIFLPTGTLYGQMDLTDSLTMEAYWQYEYLPSELFADGSYWEAQDMLESNILLVNSQLYDCMYGFNKTFSDLQAPAPPITLDGIGGAHPCDGNNYMPSGLEGFEHTLQANVNAMYRARDVYPSHPADQYGLAFRKLLNGGSEAGIYFVQYHDKYPSLWAGNNGGKDMGTLGYNSTVNPSYTGPDMNSFNAPGFNTNWYTIEYPQRIKLIGLTYNTVIDDIQMGFEFDYRKNQPVVPACTTAELDAGTFSSSITDADITALGPVDKVYPSYLKGLTFQSACRDASAKWYAATGGYQFSTGAGHGWNSDAANRLLAWPTQAEVFSWNYGVTLVVPPTMFWDTGIFVGELGGWYVGDGFQNQDLKVTSIGGFTKSGDGFSGIFLPQYKNVLEGLDLTVPVFINYTFHGSFSYYDFNEHALWASIGVEGIYLSNTRVAITYSAFGGRNNMWQDRDNIAISAKYTF